MEIIVDIYQLLYAAYEKSHKDHYNKTKDLQRQIECDTVEYIFSKISWLMYDLDVSANEIILAWDHGSWRRKDFQYYKAVRRADRDKGLIDRKAMYEFFTKLHFYIEKLFPMRSIRVKSCEGDDVVGTIVLQNPDSNFLIISRDHDFLQLMRDGVQLYDHICKRLITEYTLYSSNTKTHGKRKIKWKVRTKKEAKLMLLWHIIRGDSGDGIPPVTCPDDLYINPTITATGFKSVAPTVLLKTMFPDDKINQLELAKLQHEFERNFNRNNRLINLKATPASLKKEIMKQYKDQSYEFDNDLYKEFIIQYDLQYNMDKIRPLLVKEAKRNIF